MALRTVSKEEPEEKKVTLEGLANLAVVKEVLDVALAAKEKVATIDSDKLPIVIPDEEDFGTKDFKDAEELDAICRELIQNKEAFAHLSHISITCLWKAEGGKSKNKPTLGKVVKVSGLLSFYTDSEYVIWLAADHNRTWSTDGTGLMPRLTIEAEIFHELKHLGYDPKEGEVIMVDHDAEMFFDELSTYGMWRHSLKAAGEACRQLSLL